MNWRSWLGLQPSETVFDEYKRAFDTTWASSTPIEAVRFAVLDTETSGLNASKDNILSIAAIGVSHGAIQFRDSFHAWVKHSLVTQSVQIHMITPATAETGYAPEEAIEKFAIWLQDAVLVGHHIAFDSAILSHTLHRHKGCSLQNKSIDTALLAIRLLEPPHNREHLQPSDYSLSKLAGKLKIPVFEQHTAAGDALTTALVFLKLFTMAKARGIHTLGDLCK